MIAAGIDEAGYGPMLGPLVVACAAAESARAVPFNALRRFGIRDSKQFPPGPGRLARLASLALPFLGRPRTWIELLERCALGDVSATPWYREDGPLHDAGDPPGRWRWRVRLVIVEPREINAGAKKSEVLFSATARLLRDLPGPARVYADAQGMRRSYRALLEPYFDDVRTLEERRGRWRYRLGRTWLQFRTRGESAHDLTALASVVAKYVRELCMERVSGYWRRRCGLELPFAPVSGYHNERTYRFADEVIRHVMTEISEDDVIRRR